MDESALVVGTGDGNIGEQVVKTLSNEFAVVHGAMIRDQSDVPTVEYMYERNYQHLIVTCGFMQIEPFHLLDPIVNAKIIQACLTTPLKAIHNFLCATQPPQNECCVIVIGSYGHDHILSNSVPYCAAKAGINHAVKCLAWDYTNEGYRFNCINPHSVSDTPMSHRVIEQIERTKGLSTSEAHAYWERTLLLPKRLTRAEVAEVVLWLMNSPTAHLSGSSIELYGGER